MVYAKGTQGACRQFQERNSNLPQQHRYFSVTISTIIKIWTISCCKLPWCSSCLLIYIEQILSSSPKRYNRVPLMSNWFIPILVTRYLVQRTQVRFSLSLPTFVPRCFWRKQVTQLLLELLIPMTWKTRKENTVSTGLWSSRDNWDQQHLLN